MTEHRIRFRLGWQLQPNERDEPPTKFSLPTHWADHHVGRVRLIRRFGRPRSNIIGETFRIEILQAPGLVGVRLNDQILEIEAEDDVNLLERNTLELVVDLDPIPRSGRSESWGEVSLVIRSEA